MSERERWVIYPLLFLALGAALRDKLFDRTMARSIVCQELTVVDEQPTANQPGRVLARIGRTESANAGDPRGFLYVNGEVEVVEETVVGHQVATVPVVKIGRQPQSQGGRSNGYLVVKGLLQANRINADQYLYRGLSFAPAMQAIIPWTPNDLMRALRPPTSSPQPQSPAPEANAPPDSDNADDSDPESPLADPPENR
jgi:hypothetical protein